jgi:hypothetical protein
MTHAVSSRVPPTAALYVGGVQCYFVTLWTVYVIFLAVSRVPFKESAA